MPNGVYGLDAPGKFYLVAVPTLVGAILRIPYSVATARFGGRNWTIFNSLLLLIPAVLALIFTYGATAADHPSYTTLLVIAAFAGFGGGNFASSMTNINAFYPQRLKGWALGLNAGGGNIGVPAIQLVALLVIALTTPANPTILISVYLVVIAAAAVGAALFMDNLADQKADLGAMRRVLGTSDAWVVSLLYVGTFGSFIGFSFAFAQILQIGFLADLNAGLDAADPARMANAGNASLHAAQIAFLGPLLGSLARPLGGKLADRLGGSRITLVTFVTMIVSIALVIWASTMAADNGGVAKGGTLTLFLVGFILLFVLTGVGNGSVYKMIPGIYTARASRLDAGHTPLAARAWTRAMSGALIGFAGAIGALGGVAINVALRSSYASTKSATNAFWAVLAFYALCAVVTYAVYVRRARAADAVAV